MYLDICSHYEVNISKDKAELYEKIMSVKLSVIVIIDFKRYLVHIKMSTFYLKIRITTFKLHNICGFI